MLSLVAVLGTLELTPDNFDAEIFQSGKAGFVKFLAPWCGHCKSMKPAWDSLATQFQGSDKVLIADVDCTAGGEPLCSRFGVEGFPTIKYFNPPDEEGEDYEGGRDEASLVEFAKTKLGPGCSASQLQYCSAEEKAELEEVSAMTEEARSAELEAITAEMKAKEEAHDELLKSLQAQYDASNEEVEELKKKLKPRIKLLKKAGAKAAPAAAKEEL